MISFDPDLISADPFCLRKREAWNRFKWYGTRLGDDDPPFDALGGGWECIRPVSKEWSSNWIERTVAVTV